MTVSIALSVCTDYYGVLPAPDALFYCRHLRSTKLYKSKEARYPVLINPTTKKAPPLVVWSSSWLSRLARPPHLSLTFCLISERFDLLLEPLFFFPFSCASAAFRLFLFQMTS